jgi:hypothetical protein
MQLRVEDNNFIIIYLDASKVLDREGISIGLVAYNTA